MSIFKRKQKGPPSYDTISIPPSYNEVTQLPSYEELMEKSDSTHCAKKAKLDHTVNESNNYKFSNDELIKQMYTTRQNSYIIIKDTKFNLDKLVMEIVNNKHTTITIYDVNNMSDSNCIFKINDNRHLVKPRSKLIVLGFYNSKIEVEGTTISGNKFGHITPICKISIHSSSIDSKLMSSCVYNHLESFLIK